MSYYPIADISIIGNSAGSYTSGPFKGLLHTTEGSSASGAVSAFKKNNSWPHFLVDYQGKVWQFIDTNKAARALRHPAGTVETNRDSVIQIEIVGFASKPNEHPVLQWDALKALMRWVEQVHGVKSEGPGRPFASAYGQNELRFTDSEWDTFDKWCGHCHCPRNLHWDPGAINIQSLLLSPPSTGPVQEYPDGENMLKRIDLHAVADSNGNGWFLLDIIPQDVVSIVINGSYPPADGYWKLPNVGRQDRGGSTIIEVENGRPNQSIDLSVWCIGA